MKEPGLERRLVVDPHPRHSFVTYFSDATSPEQFLFVDGDAHQIRFSDWDVPTQSNASNETKTEVLIQHKNFSLVKSIEIDGPSVKLSLITASVPDIASSFFVEINLTVLTDQADDRYMLVDGERQRLNTGIQAESVSTLALVDEWQKRRAVLEPSLPAKLISYPVYTISSSEAGFERTYQGTCIMLGFDPVLLQDGIAVVLQIQEL